MADTAMGVALESVAHVIQVALTPVFPLSGVGTLLNVFTSRLARVTDHMEHQTDLLRADPFGDWADERRLHLHRLRRRTAALDSAVGLGATAGAATALATLTLFVGALRDSAAASALFLLFGLAVLCTVLALAAFLAKTVLPWVGMRAARCRPRQRAARRPGPGQQLVVDDANGGTLNERRGGRVMVRHPEHRRHGVGQDTGRAPAGPGASRGLLAKTGPVTLLGSHWHGHHRTPAAAGCSRPQEAVPTAP